LIEHNATSNGNYPKLILNVGALRGKWGPIKKSKRQVTVYAKGY